MSASLLLPLCPEGASISFAVASVSSWAGGLVAGTLFGFSPYLMHEDPFGHFNLTWLFFPPLAYYLLRRILLDEGSASRQGLALGALVVVQYFTSTEILLDCVILAVPMTLIFLARHFRDGPRVPKRLLIALSCACLVAVPLLAYPLWVTLAGPYHVLLNPAKASGITLSNPAWPSANSPSAAGFVVPHRQRLRRSRSNRGRGSRPVLVAPS